MPTLIELFNKPAIRKALTETVTRHPDHPHTCDCIGCQRAKNGPAFSLSDEQTDKMLSHISRNAQAKYLNRL